MIFSALADSFPQTPNRLYAARDAMIAAGDSITDLISGNPHQAGICYPQQLLKEILLRAADQARFYRPDSLGQPSAREAVANLYRRAKLSLTANEIVLTPGTSLSYLYCFRLLGEAGDEILCPSPSYPLFETIAQICQLRLTSYRLQETCEWKIDLDHLESQLTTRTKAIVLISPHNPTGSVADVEVLAGLADIALRHQVALVADEVFSEFIFDGTGYPRLARTNAPLVFTLNGFSKMLALPGMKLGWIAVSGDPDKVQKAIRALEMISDTFLPVNEVAQFALADLLDEGSEFLAAYQHFVRGCRDEAVGSLSRSGALRLVPPRGGFYMTMDVGLENDAEEDLAIDILRECHLLLHPGYFYDITGNHLVMSFLEDREILRRSLSLLIESLEKR